MSSDIRKTLRRFHVGGLPLIQEVLRRMGLTDLLEDGVPGGGRQEVSPASVLTLLAANLTLAKDPLYELEQWVEAQDLRVLGYPRRPNVRFTDDRFARALDALYRADRSSLLTRLVVSVVRRFDLDLGRIHNDSTSVKAFGRIPGRTRTGFELHHGHSKDHRPDLKQLVFSLSICADGAVPVHHRVYSGNRNDETTHVETWQTLRQIHGRPDFLYVGDCKLCTREQLEHIVAQGGRAITSPPQNLLEIRQFVEQLRAGPVPVKRRIWRRPKPNDEAKSEYFDLFDGQYRSRHGDYPIWWFASNEKRLRDREERQARLQAAEATLRAFSPRVNGHGLKKKRKILRIAQAILEKHKVEPWIELTIRTHIERRRQRRRGRPGKNPRYQIRCRVSYSLHWLRNVQALHQAARIDGIFPLLCTDVSVSPKDVLKAYKYQPHIEKRFSQFKSFHRAAPLLFKRIDRVEANMFVFFIALMIQALIERQVRQRLKETRAGPLRLYPEDRDAPHPTTSQVLKTFDGLSSYQITDNDQPVEDYHDPLSDTHRKVIALFDITEQQFWRAD
jgi:transposase